MAMRVPNEVDLETVNLYLALGTTRYGICDQALSSAWGRKVGHDLATLFLFFFQFSVGPGRGCRAHHLGKKQGRTWPLRGYRVESPSLALNFQKETRHGCLLALLSAALLREREHLCSFRKIHRSKIGSRGHKVSMALDELHESC